MTIPADLVANTNLAIGLKDFEIELQYPDCVDGLVSHTVRRDSEPDLFRVLFAVITADESEDLDVEVSEEVWRRLRELGVLVPRAELAADVLFECTVDDPPFNLVPSRHTAVLERMPPPCTLSVNCTFKIERPYSAPGYGDVRVVPFVVSVQDPITGATYAYGSSSHMYEQVVGLKPGAQEPSNLPSQIRAALYRAGILVTARAWQQPKRRQRYLESAQKEFVSRSVTILRDLWHPLQTASLRKYYRALVREGYARRGDEQVPHRFALHNERIATLIQGELTGFVSEIVGYKVRSSYCYLSSYWAGAVVDRHIDRDESELALSLLVDAGPDDQEHAAWPLLLELQDGATMDARLTPGDAVLFRGTEVPHSRPPLAAGRWSTSILLFYVRAP